MAMQKSAPASLHLTWRASINYDVGTLLDTQGIAVRTGHHCTQPIMAALGISGTVRAAIALYNTKAELDALEAALRKVKKMLGK